MFRFFFVPIPISENPEIDYLCCNETRIKGRNCESLHFDLHGLEVQLVLFIQQHRSTEVMLSTCWVSILNQKFLRCSVHVVRKLVLSGGTAQWL